MATDLQPTPGFIDGDVSWWFRELGMPQLRPALPGETTVDVAIVGGGLSGLWTAYYLKQQQPDLRIAVLEREFAGFGASGRNGGWLSAEPPVMLGRHAAKHGIDAAVRMQRAMFDTVKDVVEVTEREGIEAHLVYNGLLHVATNEAQLGRLKNHLPTLRRYGWTDADLWLLDADELAARVRIAGALGASYSPHCARVQPARLVRGLATVVEASGVAIYEGTTVEEVSPGQVRTDHGLVRASYVIRALEGFTASLPGYRRSWLPMSSSMVVTEPLPDSAWAEIGWQSAELIGDEAHGFAYAQRTADGRIALGGRAVPYRYGSRTDRRGETMGDTVDRLREVVGRHFPAAKRVGIEHAWAGVLGVPRDWCATVGLDQTTGMGWAGGYVGHGVASTCLAGHTLADLILRNKTDRTTLPWVGHRVRRWEPEPMRWLAVQGLYKAYHLADRQEHGSTSSRTSPVARIADKITGRSG